MHNTIIVIFIVHRRIPWLNLVEIIDKPFEDVVLHNGNVFVSIWTRLLMEYSKSMHDFMEWTPDSSKALRRAQIRALEANDLWSTETPDVRPTSKQSQW